jgi:hypothetical protein
LATVTLHPNANGDYIQLFIGGTSPPSQNWDCVDESPPNDDVDFVFMPAPPSGSAADHDIYKYPASGIPSGSTINSVTVYHRDVKVQSRTAVGRASAVIKTYGTEYMGASHTLTTSWTNYSDAWATNPYTLQPWTIAEIDALQAGVYLYDGSIYVESDCTQVYVVVDYTPVAVAVTRGDGLVWIVNALRHDVDVGCQSVVVGKLGSCVGLKPRKNLTVDCTRYSYACLVNSNSYAELC